MFEQSLLPALQLVRKRFLDTIADLTADQLGWRLAQGSNSIGFLIRHIAEVEYRFCLMFFRRPLPSEVTLFTIGRVQDEGQFTDLASLLEFGKSSYEYLGEALRALPEGDWDVPTEAPIGVMTPREALGRLMFHTGYHAGQIGLIRKYGGVR